MFEFTPESFGQLNAEDYDTHFDPGNADQIVEFVKSYQPDGQILEFAIGTGRVALPLAAAGHKVIGIEGSQEMVAKMRAKPGGADVPTTIGDFAHTEMSCQFDFVLLVYNTLFNLNSQDHQVACFKNAAKHLKPGGRFILECFVPDLTGFKDNQRVSTQRVGEDHAWLEAALHDPCAQKLHFQRIRITQRGVQLVPLPMRYAYPPEMDLMGQLASMPLEHRFEDWQKSAFTANSKSHISVYRKR